jgi:hypothetical protein
LSSVVMRRMDERYAGHLFFMLAGARIFRAVFFHVLPRRAAKLAASAAQAYHARDMRTPVSVCCKGYPALKPLPVGAAGQSSRAYTGKTAEKGGYLQ